MIKELMYYFYYLNNNKKYLMIFINKMDKLRENHMN